MFDFACLNRLFFLEALSHRKLLSVDEMCLGAYSCLVLVDRSNVPGFD